MSPNLIGQTLLNQFRIDAFIASGGMGAVYRVWDLKRNVPLAMKVLHADLADDPSVFKRFKREAIALKKLAHPNIVPFYGLYQTSDFAFLLERYVDGPSLKDILRKQQGKPLPVDEALTYLKTLSAALGYAHANGVVHCDVKPGNVMIDQGGNIYLTDFGIARHSESTATTLVTVGTVAYMAPEQIRGEAVSPATDVYTLGLMLYEMLTGQRPFKVDEKGTESGGSRANERIRYAHLILPPPDPRVINPELNEEFTQVILKALQKEASQRYQSTHELFISACKAVNIQPETLPDRIISSAIQNLIPGSNYEIDVSRTSYKRRGLVPVALSLFGVLVVATIYLKSTGSLSHLLSGLPVFNQNLDNPTQISTNFVYSPTPALVQYTTTFIPVTDTPRFSTATPSPRFSTPMFLTSTPIYANYTFTAAENLMCRRGPDTYYEHAYDVYKGETYPVIARWSNDWILLKIAKPRVATRTRCCWVSENGSLNVAIGNILLIDYWVEDMRITCDIP